MNTLLRRIVLGLTVVVAGYVGIWAEFFPRAFYSTFPGFGLHWIHLDGPVNEHLIRDVGSLYIALGAGSIAAIISRSAMPGRVVGLAWSVFGVLHFGYHVLHPEGSTLDIVGNLVSLGISALLGIILLFPHPHTPDLLRHSAARWGDAHAVSGASVTAGQQAAAHTSVAYAPEPQPDSH